MVEGLIRPDERYVHVKNGKIHRFPAFEECNLDDSTEREDINGAQVAEVAAEHPERLCARCFPKLVSA